MKKHRLNKTLISQYVNSLMREEKSQNTIEKYLRDVKAFIMFCEGRFITKETVIQYKQKLIRDGYAIRSINSMLSSLNSLFSFLDWEDLKIKTIKVQKEIYRPEEKELTLAEYRRLCQIAEKKHKNRLSLILQTLCGSFFSGRGSGLMMSMGPAGEHDSFLKKRGLIR